MKAVILAGGFGTRIAEETHLKPKPMVEIGGKPILWHIMKGYSHHGVNEFIICCGYKGYMIKEYFANYFYHESDVTFYLDNNRRDVHRKGCEPWTVTLVDTGEQTMTGGRLKRVLPYVKNEKSFCFTYGDGVSDVNVTELIAFHHAQNVKATLTAVVPPSSFGALTIVDDKVREFREKPANGTPLVNGGFFVLTPAVMDLIKDDDTIWERGPLEQLAQERQLAAYRHEGFWQPMDTLRDRRHLEDLWNRQRAPWKVWE